MILGMPYDWFLLRIPVILLALTIHELAHGYAAYKLGDPTAKYHGRLTLNPVAHLDLLGTIMLMTGLFGWAKPVPVNTHNLRNPKRDLMIISFAGPASNIVLALLFGFSIRFIAAFDLFNNDFFMANNLDNHLLTFLILGFLINAGLAFFNMLPFYPLDGSKVLAGFLPDRAAVKYLSATRYALPVIFGLVIIGAFTGYNLLSTILNPVFGPYMRAMQFITFGSGTAIF